ncbi:hypothetical protein ACILPE_03435 [Capnocytophaga canimorsus]|uniref:hypothetical protein n=1 Tax=Capnocytophaga canimorsus TaxID=28188 RepID=UPI0037D274C4
MKKNRYLEEDFIDFLQELKGTGCFVHDTKLEGIVSYTIDNGFEKLSDKQKYVLEQGILDYKIEECQRCGLDIPWSEMIAAAGYRGWCSWCQQLGRDE